MPASSPRVSGAVSRLLQAGQISRVDEASGVLQTLHANCPHDGERASVRRMSRELGGPVMEVIMRCAACFRDFVAAPDALYLHPRTPGPARAAAAPAPKPSAKKAAPAAAKQTSAKSAPAAANKAAPQAAKKTAPKTAKTAKKAAPKAVKQASKSAAKAVKAAKKSTVKRAASSRAPAPSKSRRT